MKKTITKMLGLALGVFSLSAMAQCPTISSVIPTYNLNGQVSLSISLSGVGTSSLTSYGAYFIGNGINSNYSSFGYSNNGSLNFPCNGTYSVVVNYNDSTTNCFDYYSSTITITNSANTCSTTTSNCASVSNFSFIPTSNAGQYQLNISTIGSYTGTTNFSAYASGPGYVISQTGFGASNMGTLTFDQDGVYNVCVYMQDSTQGCSDYYCQNVTVSNAGSVSTPTCFADASFALFQDSTNLGTYYAYNYGGGTGNVSYLWNFGDGTTSTQAYPTHVYASAGFYTLCLTVTATDSIGNSTCTDTQCSIGGFKISASGQMGNVIVKNPATSTGIKESNNVVATLSAYPNPIADELTIELVLKHNSTALVYTIVDALGKVVAQNKLTDFKTTINTVQLEKGFYFLSISNEKGAVVKSTKLVK